MANKLKSSKKQVAEPAVIPQETEETTEIKELLKDERTHKIAGSIFLLFAVLLFVAFTSYLFTWQDDQDKVFQLGKKLLWGTDVRVSNLLGTFGAFIAHFFIYKGFGVASYLICSLFFVVGINLFFGKKVFSIARNIKYLILGLPVISVAISVIMNGNNFAWGGAVGDMSRDWMYKIIGEIGTIGVLAVAVLSYIIWRFNPVFRLPGKKDLNNVLNEEEIKGT
ncbi:MAG: DNA translocase FtsK 4TM domain-containing protein, partial [Ferruginibacter sp.]